ncbi:deaminase [Paracoccus contaminans]|nr:deaminase [Paracoccus contaminans]
MVKPINPKGAAPRPEAPRPTLGGNRQESASNRNQAPGIGADLALDLTQIGLDITGLFDPTFVSDGANALISLGRGDLGGAALSVVSILPAGDLVKLGKLGKYADTLGKIVDKVAGNPLLKDSLEQAVGTIAKALDKIPQGMIDQLPASARNNLDRLKDAVARFDKAPGHLLGPRHGTAALAAQRAARGLPPAGAQGDASTVAMIRLRGQDYVGVNSSVQQPRTTITLDRVNAQTRTHAEADAVQQALNGTARKRGGQAEMWVDRDLCRSCGPNGGMRSLARNLGVDELIVHTPSGTQIFKPTR